MTCVLGYYKSNFGDERYKDAFRILFPGKQLTFRNVVNSVADFSKFTTVVVGGGDVINAYFRKKVEKLLKGYEGRVVLFSAGIPYPDSLDFGTFAQYDHVFLRNPTDESLVQKYLGKAFVHTMHDAVFALPLYEVRRDTHCVVSLTQSIYRTSAKHTAQTEKNFIALKMVLKHLHKKYKRVNLVRFDSSLSPYNDDSYINAELQERLQSEVRVHRDDTVYDYEGMFRTFAKAKLALCMRLHSHVMCIKTATPFVSIGVTRKVRLLLEQHNLSDLLVDTVVDGYGQPKHFDWRKIIEKITYVEENWETISARLSVLRAQLQADLLSLNVDLDTLPLRKSKVSAVYSRKDTIDKIIAYYSEFGVDLFQGKPQEIFDPTYAKSIAQMMAYDVTKNIDSEYIYGLAQKMSTDPHLFEEYLDYIEEEVRKSVATLRKLDMNYIVQSAPGYHRSGWAYVMDNLLRLQNTNGVYFDGYMDRTFHWGEETLLMSGILPYSKPWVGVIHHVTQQEELYTPYNATALLEKQSFLDSLPNCKGIFVLSYDLKNKLRKYPVLDNIAINVLKHPTEFVSRLWSKQKWKSNLDKKVVQIGAWMRNTFAPHKLQIAKNCKKTMSALRICILRGKNMEHYLPRDNWYIAASDSGSSEGCMMQPYCRGSAKDKNKWFMGVESFVKDLQTQVEILPRMTNLQYDELLEKNVVFLNLAGVSASNAIIECIVRNTPLVVNRLPAAEEYLGKTYPLFYDTISEACALLSSFDKIYEGHTYLKKLDKDFLTIESFIKSLKESTIYASL